MGEAGLSPSASVFAEGSYLPHWANTKGTYWTTRNGILFISLPQMCPGQEWPSELGGWHLEDQRQPVTKSQLQHSSQGQALSVVGVWESGFSACSVSMQLPGLASLKKTQVVKPRGDEEDGGCCGCFFLDLIKAGGRHTVFLLPAEIGTMLTEWKHFDFN